MNYLAGDRSPHNPEVAVWLIHRHRTIGPGRSMWKLTTQLPTHERTFGTQNRVFLQIYLLSNQGDSEGVWFGIRRSSRCPSEQLSRSRSECYQPRLRPIRGRDEVVTSTPVSGDARKGQEKGNILDVAALRNAEASNALNSQYLVDTCTRVCVTDPLVLTRW